MDSRISGSNSVDVTLKCSKYKNNRCSSLVHSSCSTLFVPLGNSFTKWILDRDSSTAHLLCHDLRAGVNLLVSAMIRGKSLDLSKSIYAAGSSKY